MDCFEGLNVAQAEVVGAPESRHMLVVAGPGTGKTFTIVRRIVCLARKGVPPETIAAVTFTNRAAREMRERLDGLLTPGNGKPFVGTFHVLGMQILKRFCGKEISVITRDRQIELLQTLSGGTRKQAKALAGIISRARSMLMPPDNETGALYEAYRATLRDHGWVDFDDLINEPLHLIRTGLLSDTAVVPYRYFLVDEYQDVSPSQYSLLSAMMGEGAAVCAVGDADQAIYSFRGADMTGFLDFHLDFPASTTVTLAESYRSTGNILGCASALVDQNTTRIKKDLVPKRHPGPPVRVVSVPDDFTEAAFVAQEIEARIGAMDHLRLSHRSREPVEALQGAYRFGDFAVLFRTNAQAGLLRRSLDEAGIPCQIAVGTENRWRGIIDHLVRGREEGSPGLLPDMLLLEAWKAAGSPGEWTYLEALAHSYDHYPATEALDGIIEELKLMDPLDCFDRLAGKVSLMTFHMAKGLEFDVVFIVGAEEGLTPLLWDETSDNVEEERRLFYVAMTRSRDELFVISSRTRTLFGKRSEAVPSRFITELPEDLVERVEVRGRKRREKKQATLF